VPKPSCSMLAPHVLLLRSGQARFGQFVQSFRNEAVGLSTLSQTEWTQRDMTTSVSAIYELGIPHNKFALTMPDGTYYPDFITQPDKRPVEFLRHFDRVRSKPWGECSFLDLGCSEGTTTLGLSQMGSTVYGVEGRADGIDRANVLKGIVGFGNTHYWVDNVVNDSAFREVDGIFNAGILYHLEDPIGMMEKCARFAKSFVYVDTGHAPKDVQERENSKFSSNFGREYRIDYRGLELNVVDFAEPGDTREKADGLRRGPRSGIGNSNSVWLGHGSLIDLMKELGFPYHETVKYAPIIPRLRTCFFREEPRDLGFGLKLTQPLPVPADERTAIRTTMERDLAYLEKTEQPIHVLGCEPVFRQTMDILERRGIRPTSATAVPGNPADKVPTARLRQVLGDKSGIVVLALTNPMHTVQAVVKLDRFKLAITSIGIMLSPMT